MKRSYEHTLDLIIVLTQKEIKVRYKNSFLGYLWSVCHPLAFAFVFFLAFKVVMRVTIEDYALFLIAGLFPWQWFSNAVIASPVTYIENASIIKKVSFPRNLLPFTHVLQDMIHFMLAIPVVVLFLLIHHKTPAWSWFYGIPVLLVIQFMTTYGVCLFVSSLNLFFRDLERLATIGMTLLFYVTPVIYPETMIPEKFRLFVNLNPLSPMIIAWRNLFLHGVFDVFNVFLSLVFSLLLLQIGRMTYRRLSPRFAEVL